MAKLVEKAYGKEGPTRVLKEQTPYFIDKGEGIRVAEYSGVVDIHIAQAMTNTLMPAEYHLTIASLEKQALNAATPHERVDIHHRITTTKQKVYAAMLNAYGVVGYEKDGKILGQFGAQEQLDIVNLSRSIKESRSFKETQGMTMFEANRYSLAQVASEITGISVGKLKAFIDTLPIEATVEAFREKYRGKLAGESSINDIVREQLSEDFIKLLKTEYKIRIELRSAVRCE